MQLDNAITFSRVLFIGLVAGKHYNEQGSGVNTLCLPHDPEPAPSDFPSKLHGGLYARIWGE